ESRMRVDLLDLPRIALERWRMLAVGVVAGLALAFAFNANTRPVYESQTTLMLNGQVTLTDNSQAEAQNALSQDLVHTYAELIRARPVAEAVVARLQLPISPDDLQQRLRASVPTGTSLLTLYATAGSRAEAQQIAQAVADEFVRQAPLLATPQNGRPPVKLTIVEPASLPGPPIAPRPVRNLAVGALMGLLAGLALGIVRDRRHQRVRGADE